VPKREENPQARVPGSDRQSRPMAGAERFDRALIPRSQEGAATLLVGDHATHSLFAAVVQLVGHGHGRCIL